MKNKNILIAYGTRYGTVEEISQKVAKTLESNGFQTQLFNLGVGKAKDWPVLSNFDGIIFGTSMKVNAWKKQVKSFVKKNIGLLKKINFGFFTCGAYAIAEPTLARDDIAKRLKDKFDLKADIYDVFGGILDFSEDSKVGKSGRLALKLAAMGISKETGFEFNMEGCNDFRDWDKIHEFSEKCSELFS